MLRYLLVGFVFVAVIVGVAPAPAAAQDALDVTIFLDSNSLTVYIPGNQPVRLFGLGFEIGAGTERQLFLLQNLNTFGDLNFEAVETPVCFRLVRQDSNAPVSLSCQGITSVTHTVSAYDVFWYDLVNHQGRTFHLMSGTMQAGICPAGQIECRLSYPNHDPAEFYDVGRTYSEQQEYDQAVEAYTQAIALGYSPLAEPYYRRGVAYYYMPDDDDVVQDLANAIDDFTRAIELNFDPLSWPYRMRGLAYQDTKEHELAIENFTRAIELEHNPLSWPYYNRGRSYRELQEYEKAIADFTQAIELDPNYSSAYYQRALVYKDMGEYDLSIDDFTSNIALDPESATAHHMRGTVYLDSGQYELAIADFTHAIEFGFSSPAWSYLHRGNAHLALEHYDQAIADFTESKTIDPEYAAAYRGLGDVYYAQERYQEALEIYRQYIDLACECASEDIVARVAELEAQLGSD